ncbi:MAG: hypothetical protein GX601_04660 [Anaerolineales bacterium]|nr:hypothetical protein [Anaerolineales bacterium]
MTLRTVFIIDAIAATLFGLGFVLAPEAAYAVFGLQLDAGAAHITRALGLALIANAVKAWLARNSGPSVARRALVMGQVAFMALLALEDLRAVLAGVVNTAAWGTVILLAALAALNAYVGLWSPAARAAQAEMTH